MALQAASIHAQRMRITRLDSDGTEAAGATASYVTSDVIQVAINPEVTEGEEREVISGGDAVCVSYKGATKLKRFSLELQGCKVDPYLFELLLGAPFVLDGANKIGISFPDQNSTSFSPQQVMVEFWSDAWNGDAPDTANGGPYWHWVFPYVKVRYTGDREFGNSALANEFEGQGLGNDALVPAGLYFDSGSSDTAFPAVANEDFVVYKSALSRPFTYVRSCDPLPTPGFYWVGEETDWDAALVIEPGGS